MVLKRHKRGDTTFTSTAPADTRPAEPRPQLIYKENKSTVTGKGIGWAAKYGQFSGEGSTKNAALDDLLVNMYRVVSNVKDTL